MTTPTKILFSMVSLFAIGKIFSKPKDMKNKNTLTSPTGNLINIRPCDPAGCGYFGAPRTNHRHQGLDIVVRAGQNIYAPISGTVRKLQVYRNSPAMTGLEITNGTIKIKMFYVAVLPQIKTGTKVNAGDMVGLAQDVAAYYNSSAMTVHIHVEVRDNGRLIDPAVYFKDLLE